MCVCSVYCRTPRIIIRHGQLTHTHKNDGFMSTLVNFPRLQFRTKKKKIKTKTKFYSFVIIEEIREIEAKTKQTNPFSVHTNSNCTI